MSCLGTLDMLNMPFFILVAFFLVNRLSRQNFIQNFLCGFTFFMILWFQSRKSEMDAYCQDDNHCSRYSRNDNHSRSLVQIILALPYQTQACKRYCNLPPFTTGQQMILSGRKNFHTQLLTER